MNLFTVSNLELRNKIQFVTISLDPEYSQPEQLFAKPYNLMNKHWSFLTGEIKTIKRVLNSFNIIASMQNGNKKDIFGHSSQVFLITNNH